MTGTGEGSPRVHLAAQPILRGGRHLVLSSTVSSMFGLLYWLVAARLYEPEVVGRESTLLYAMMFLAGAAQLSLASALLRFVPVAGARARALTRNAYLVGGGLSALAGVVFALGAPAWSPAHAELLGGTAALWFALATGGWAIFVLQDSVLTAIGRTPLVPATNTIFAVVKLGLLVVLATVLPQYGIVVSWTVATLVLVTATTGYLFTRGLPEASAGTQDGTQLTVRRIGHFVGGDSVGSLFWTGATMLLPVLVLNQLGPTPAAVYALSWAIAYTLYLVASGMGNSLVAHASADPANLRPALRSIERHTLLLLTPVVAAVVVAAPVILGILGTIYAEQGSWLLRLLALSAIPNVVTRLAVSAARVRHQLRAVIAIQGAIATLVISLSLVLLPTFGVVGVGIAWLIGQTGVAAAILLGRLAWLPGPLARVVAAPRQSRLLHQARTEMRRCAGCELWEPHGRVVGCSDTVVALVGPDSPSGGVLKVAATDRARTDLTRQSAVLAALHHDPRLVGYRTRLPRILAEADGGRWVVESRLPGTDGRSAHTEPDARIAVLENAAATIGELHRATARVVTTDHDLLARWVHAPAEVVRGTLDVRRRERLDRVVDRVCAGLDRQPVACGWTHGDCCLDNVLVRPDGRIAGLVDWSQAHPRGPVITDVVHLLVTAEALAGRRELGSVVLAWLESVPPNWDLVTSAQQALGAAPLDHRTLVLLTWLHHVSGNIAKSARIASNPVWKHRNVHAVLAAHQIDARLTSRSALRGPGRSSSDVPDCGHD